MPEKAPGDHIPGADTRSRGASKERGSQDTPKKLLVAVGTSTNIATTTEKPTNAEDEEPELRAGGKVPRQTKLENNRSDQADTTRTQMEKE